jgi:lycopene cyclase domain-containing protein
MGFPMLEYLIVMLIFVVPFIMFAVCKRLFIQLGLAGAMGLIIGVPWDLTSSGYFHTWSWNKETLMGIWIGPLPLEEYLFMVLLPMMLIGAALIFGINLQAQTLKKRPRS